MLCIYENYTDRNNNFKTVVFYLYYNTLFQELEMRIDTQKQTLTARDESIKKLLEMLQNKGDGKKSRMRE